MRTAITFQGSELQNFLYAPICQDQEGTTLSVLSAIARQNIDPWTEAARLAQLPKQMAVKQIVCLLDALPTQTVPGLDSVGVAARLNVLLPRPAAVKRSALFGGPAATRQNPPAFALNWRFVCIYLCFVLLMNWLMAQSR